jgi:predicted transcriptional regulator
MRFMSMKVEDIMIESIIAVDVDDTVKKASRRRNKHEIGCLIEAHVKRPRA